MPLILSQIGGFSIEWIWFQKLLNVFKCIYQFERERNSKNKELMKKFHCFLIVELISNICSIYTLEWIDWVEIGSVPLNSITRKNHKGFDSCHGKIYFIITIVVDKPSFILKTIHEQLLHLELKYNETISLSKWNQTVLFRVLNISIWLYFYRKESYT